MTTPYKTSVLIPYQLPAYIRDDPDYEKFILFLQAYYEWGEQSGNFVDFNNNLQNYSDIDQTTDAFVQYYVNEFLPYFPQDALIDQRKMVKIARQLYSTKGTPSSYSLLFRVLYNSDVDLFYTKDALLKVSDGKWYVPQILSLKTIDPNFLNINNYRIFGQISKSFATVSYSERNGNKTYVYIENIQRLFQSGEYITVVDINNNPVVFNGEILTAKILGSISQVNIDPNNRGTGYVVGTPVVFSGGLDSPTGIGATAFVSQTTKGSIQRVYVTQGGVGYRPDPNTIIQVSGNGGAILNVAAVNTSLPQLVATVPMDAIGAKTVLRLNSNYNFTKFIGANANTRLCDAFTFDSYYTYPITTVEVNNQGGGYSTLPTLLAESIYPTDNTAIQGVLSNLGILGPIQIVNTGHNYSVNDYIIFTGGSGLGAYANVTNVDVNGGIVTVNYVLSTNTILANSFPMGGMGYSVSALPTLSVHSANGANAVLSVNAILGTDAEFSIVTDRIGSITQITVENYGEDYISAPNVSLRIQDIAVANVVLNNLPVSGQIIYQGTSYPNSYSFVATFDSISQYGPTQANSNATVFSMRVFNYSGALSNTIPLKAEYESTTGVPNEALDSYFTIQTINDNYFNNGINVFGDGTAKANAKFLNGLIVGEGQYLDTAGQPSSYSVIQSNTYNNFTYVLSVEKEIAKYRDILLNMIHPAGLNVLGRDILKNDEYINMSLSQENSNNHSIGYYTGTPNTTATITTSFTNKSSNTITFTYLSGANLSNIFVANSSRIGITSQSINVYSLVTGVNTSSNTITIQDKLWLTFGNVAVATSQTNSNAISISTLTNSYNIINNGIYSNTAYPLMDIVHTGDNVQFANTIKTVTMVDYINSIIYTNNNFIANSNSYLSVNRTLQSSNVWVYNTKGIGN